MAAALLPLAQEAAKQGATIANTPVIGWERDTITLHAYKSGRQTTENTHVSFSLRAWELALLGMIGAIVYGVESLSNALMGVTGTVKSFAEWMSGPIGGTIWTVQNIIVPVAENPNTNLVAAGFLGGLPGLVIALIGEPKSKSPSPTQPNSEIWTWDPPIQLQMPPWVSLIFPSVKQ